MNVIANSNTSLTVFDLKNADVSAIVVTWNSTRLTSTAMQRVRPDTSNPVTPSWKWCDIKGFHRWVLRPYNHIGSPCRPQMANAPTGVLNPIMN